MFQGHRDLGVPDPRSTETFASKRRHPTPRTHTSNNTQSCALGSTTTLTVAWLITQMRIKITYTLVLYPPSLQFRVPYTCAHVPYTCAHEPIRVYGVHTHGQFCSPKMTLLYMVYGVHAFQFCLPKMTLLYIQKLPLLPEEGSELDI